MKTLAVLYVLGAALFVWLVFGGGPVGLICAACAGIGLATALAGIRSNLRILRRQSEAERRLRRLEAEWAAHLRQRRAARRVPQGTRIRRLDNGAYTLAPYTLSARESEEDGLLDPRD